MTREDPQLELFSQSGGSSGLNAGMPRHSLNLIRRYEKTVLMIIGFIIVGIASFSLGVEKGRTQIRLSVPLDKASADKPAEKEKKNVSAPPAPKEYKEQYTIQVASYQTKTSAKKEAELLKKRGFLPLILSKGYYTVVCVGSFPQKEMAKTILAELKKRYRDCFLRRL